MTHLHKNLKIKFNERKNIARTQSDVLIFFEASVPRWRIQTWQIQRLEELISYALLYYILAKTILNL